MLQGKVAEEDRVNHGRAGIKKRILDSGQASHCRIADDEGRWATITTVRLREYPKLRRMSVTGSVLGFCIVSAVIFLWFVNSVSKQVSIYLL